MSYYLRQGNIVNVATDAIVNAANTELTRTPGICEAIFSAADTVKLEQACQRIGHCAIGHSAAVSYTHLVVVYVYRLLFSNTQYRRTERIARAFDHNYQTVIICTGAFFVIHCTKIAHCIRFTTCLLYTSRGCPSTPASRMLRRNCDGKTCYPSLAA